MQALSDFGFVLKVDAELGGAEGGNGFQAGTLFGAEADGVFPGGEEGADGVALLEVEEVGDVRVGKGVVVREGGAGGEGDAAGGEGLEEFIGPGDTAEGDDTFAGGWGREFAVHDPDGLVEIAAAEFGFEGAVFCAKDEDVGAAQGGERLTEAASGQEGLLEVAGVEDDYVEVAGELAVLEAVIEDVQARAGDLALGKKASLIAAGADVDGNAGLLRYEQGFVAVAGSVALEWNVFGFARAAFVASGEDIDGDALFVGQLDEADDDGGFAAAADGEVADAEDGIVEALGRGFVTVIATIFEGEARGVERDQRQEQALRLHGWPRRMLRIVVTARPVAPASRSQTV
jgi:hypothetical protein